MTAAFIIALALYLAVATVLLYRSPMWGWGFPMFVLVYPMFLLGFWIADTQIVMYLWLALAVANMPFQFISIKRQAIPTGTTGVLIGSLFLWPIQFAALINSNESEKMADESRKAGREKIGKLPADIAGTVSYIHFVDIDEGYDAVWLEEFGDLEFIVDAKTRDAIQLGDGKAYTLSVEERPAPTDYKSGDILWITGGTQMED